MKSRKVSRLSSTIRSVGRRISPSDELELGSQEKISTNQIDLQQTESFNNTKTDRHSNKEILTHRTRVVTASDLLSSRDRRSFSNRPKRKTAHRIFNYSPFWLFCLVCMCISLLAIIIAVSIITTLSTKQY